MEPLFSPSLHLQRHQFVIDFVKKYKPRKVADLGCCDCSLLKKLRFYREIDLLVGVDINESTLRDNMYSLAPFPADYLQPGFEQLRVELYQGSVTEREPRLRRFDLVTSIELIEHLTTADLKLFSEVVFGFMTPVCVIVSTPNSEFNPLLPGLRGFRHRDHKFEWSRAEFKSWARRVCVDFGYEVEFTGVGAAPSGRRDDVGFCSQIGVFHRLGGGDESNTQSAEQADQPSPYKLLYSINYPSLRDNNTLRKVLVSEVLCWTAKLQKKWREERNHTQYESEGGGGEGEKSAEKEEKLTVCKAEKKKPVSQCENAASEEVEEEEEEGELFWGKEGRQRTSCRSHRCVSVPLDVLWSSCPKVQTLSGSLRNLTHLLMDEPGLRLSPGGHALILSDADDDDDDDDDELEDSGFAEARCYSDAAEQTEDWEAIV